MKNKPPKLKIPGTLIKRIPPENKADILISLINDSNKEIEMEITIPYSFVKNFGYGEAIMIHVNENDRIDRVVKRDSRTRSEINSHQEVLKLKKEIDRILDKIKVY